MRDTVQQARSITGIGDNRNDLDYYITPPRATQALLKVEQFSGSIWEPACGNGSISRVLVEAGYKDVRSTDLVDRGYGVGGVDFFFAPYTANCIITNPPFRWSLDFLERSLIVADTKVAFLLKLSFLEGVQRAAMFTRTPLKKVWVFSKRLTMSGPDNPITGGGMITFAWFVWEHGYTGEPTIGWLP